MFGIVLICFHVERSQCVFHCFDICLLLSVQIFSWMGLVFIWLAHFTCLSIDVRFWCWLLSCYENIMCVSQLCALVWMICYFMLKNFPMFISFVECFMLFALSVRMPYLFAYHGHDNLFHWQFCHLFCLSMSLCTITILLHYLWYCWKFCLGLHYLQFVFIYWIFFWILLTFILCGTVVWFFAVGLFFLQMSRWSSRGKDIVTDEPATPIAKRTRLSSQAS